jgi:hypothetical protein
MEHNPTDPPRARADRARHWLALVADAAFLIACLFLLYTALGGEVRSRTALFRITLTEANRPTQLCVLLLLIGRLRPSTGASSPPRDHTRSDRPTLAAVLHALDLRLRCRLSRLPPTAARQCDEPLRVAGPPRAVPSPLPSHPAARPRESPHHAVSHRPVRDLPLGAGAPDHLDASEPRANDLLQRIPVASQDGLARFRNPAENPWPVPPSRDSTVYGTGSRRPDDPSSPEATCVVPVANPGIQQLIHTEYRC